MTIKVIKMRGFRGIDKDIPLTARTLLVGPNGSGKSTTAAAAVLAWNGYVPGEDKRNAEMHAAWASAPQMAVGVVLDINGVEHEIKRGLSVKKGSVSSTVVVDGVTGGNPLQLGAAPVDIAQVYALSDRELRKLVMTASGGPDKLAEFEKAVAAEEKHRAALNAARVKAKNAEQAVARLVEEVAAVSAPGNSSQIDAELKGLAEQETSLAASVAKGEENDRIRASLLSADEVQNMRKRLDLIRDDMLKLKASRDELSASIADVDKAASRLSVLAVSEHVSDEIERAVDMIPPEFADRGMVLKILSQFTGDGQDDIREKMGRLSSKSTALSREYEAAGGIMERLGNERQAIDVKLARVDNSAIGPGVNNDEAQALAGVRTRIAALREQSRVALRRDTLARELEKARVDQAKAQKEVEAETTAVADAVTLMGKIAGECQKEVEARLQAALPASVTPFYRDSDGRIRVGLVKDGVYIVRAGLGGAERAMFDMAFARLLGGADATVFVEAAEMSDKTLLSFLEGIVYSFGQVVVMRWTNDDAMPVAIPDGWSVVRFGGAS